MPFGAVLSSLLGGVATVATHDWWLLLIIGSARFGPRIAKGVAIRRGGLR